MAEQNQTPLAESIHIVLAGITNAGKSSLLNAVFQKDIAVVSAQSGTTTDPVTRKIELGALGPCSVTDTAGLDDTSFLCGERIKKSEERIFSADFVLIASPCDRPLCECEKILVDSLNQKNIKSFGVLTFADKADEQILFQKKEFFLKNKIDFVEVDLKNIQSAQIEKFLQTIENFIEKSLSSIKNELTPVQGIVREGQTVILVTPIDSAAPKGRLILPQVETIRDLLDKNCSALVVKPEGLCDLYKSLNSPPDLVITDSQAFKEVAQILPKEQPLTSFSILFARKKGDISYFLKSLSALKNFPKDGTILIMEACSHHRQEDDIGTAKIPAILKTKFGNKIQIIHSRQIPTDFLQGDKKIDLVIHCGACMITRNVMQQRINSFKEAKIPVLNYGLFLAWANGLFPRAIQVLPAQERI